MQATSRSYRRQLLPRRLHPQMARGGTYMSICPSVQTTSTVVEGRTISMSATRSARLVRISTPVWCTLGDIPPEYTILTFIPKNLYEQFRRVANLYFFVLVIFQGQLTTLLRFCPQPLTVSCQCSLSSVLLHPRSQCSLFCSFSL